MTAAGTAALVTAIAATLGSAAGGAAAPADRCSYSGKRLVLETARVSVLSRATSFGTEFYECHRPTGTTDTLNESEFGETVFRPPAMAVSSTAVAVAITAEDGADPETDGTSFAVDRYFHEGEAGHHSEWVTLWAVDACVESDESSFCRVARAAVRPNGSAAWIACPETGCSSSATKAVFRFRNKDLSGRLPNPTERELLDKGRGIDPRSLRRKGDRIYWIKSGRRRSAPL